MVRMIEVNEPNKKPHPISCIFDCFWYFKVIKSPSIAQEANINIIKSKPSSNCSPAISKNPVKIVRTKEINFNFCVFVNIIKKVTYIFFTIFYIGSNEPNHR